MLSRLKSLPLTIVITVLIWMYAEAQFTQTNGITLIVPDVPVWIAGPPDMLARYDVDYQLKPLHVTVFGAESAIRELRQRIAAHSQGYAIRAYLDIYPDDLPGANDLTRRLRIVLPDGLTLQESAPDVEFRLVPKSVATQPAEHPHP